MLDFFKSDISLIAIFTINIILFMLVIISYARISKMNKNNKEFMQKLGTGKDIGEDLNNYMERIIELEQALSETHSLVKHILIVNN